MGDEKEGVSKMRPICAVCSDFFASARRRAGYRMCLVCGEQAARDERKGWTVISTYNKGAYQFVTTSAAPQTLRETNPKQTRS
jgi:hypothetical protein